MSMRMACQPSCMLILVHNHEPIHVSTLVDRRVGSMPGPVLARDCCSCVAGRGCLSAAYGVGLAHA